MSLNIVLGGQSVDFRPWRPEFGQVFSGAFAFDSETTAIDLDRPYLAPAYVLGAACDGARGFFVLRQDVIRFFGAHAGNPIAFHNAPFDLSVIHAVDRQHDIYQAVDEGRIWDTLLLHRLYLLGTEGQTGRGESSLERCVQAHFGIVLPKDVVDSNGHFIRLSYSRWLNRPPQEIEPVYLEYLAKDTIATWLLFDELYSRVQRSLTAARDAWGFVSDEWLAAMMQTWGPQTHHIQLKAAIVLQHITANGLHLDPVRTAELVRGLELRDGELRQQLRAFWYLPGGEGSGKALQAIFRRIERERPDLRLTRTTTGKIQTTQDVLQELASSDPFARLLLDYRLNQKLLSNFTERTTQRTLHPSFDVLARTGRTTSFGDINAQNIPTDDRVRACFVPSPGHVFIDADYKTVELATLAQACIQQFGLQSAMATAINGDRDLHSLVAARVLGKCESEVSKIDRNKAKPINFGKPGGMGDAALRQYAKASYGIELTANEVAMFSMAWFELFPEMASFLRDDRDVPLRLARLLGLGNGFEAAQEEPHASAMGFVGPEDGRRMAILGGMSLKVFGTQTPVSKNGNPYRTSDIDVFWSSLARQRHLFPVEYHEDILQRRPSRKLQREVAALAERKGVFTLTGRLRAGASYTARHNTVFQGLAADGAKLALWRLWRSGFRIVNFIHDQVLVEVPERDDLTHNGEQIRQIMIEEMRRVVPDVKIDVNAAAARRWYKGAVPVRDASGHLLVWEPVQDQAPVLA